MVKMKNIFNKQNNANLPFERALYTLILCLNPLIFFPDIDDVLIPK